MCFRFLVLMRIASWMVQLLVFQPVHLLLYQLKVPLLAALDWVCLILPYFRYHWWHVDIQRLFFCYLCWVGFSGFIKDVEISEDCIHLITPVSHKLVEKVDIIFQSCIAVPSCLLQVIVKTMLFQLFRKKIDTAVTKFPGCSSCNF